MTDPNMAAEKLTQTLPTVRVDEALAVALMRLAAKHDRPLSGYVRQVLETHCFGHARSVATGNELGNPDRASQCDALGG
jgi:hypothetical protein